jgi:glycosyltransferase involved in cell wall biosynthesis
VTADVTYVSFDSVLTGIGTRQALPYVHELARRGVKINLLSWEPTTPTDDDRAVVEVPNVRWEPQQFGRHGVVGGAGRVVRAAVALRSSDALVHARGDMPALAAALARRRFVWDMRAFWLDQRIDGGSLRAGGLTSQVLRRAQRWAARRSAKVIVLADAAIPDFFALYGPVKERADLFVVPTSTDVRNFTVAPFPNGPLRLHSMGSLNRLYDAEGMVSFFDACKEAEATELEILATEAPSDVLRRAATTIRTVAPSEIPEALVSCHAGLVLLRPGLGRGRRAAMPTKVAEYLAAGRPIVASRGVGDLDSLIVDHDVGVLCDPHDSESLQAAVEDLRALLADHDTPARCRRLAESTFGIEAAGTTFLAVYAAARADR